MPLEFVHAQSEDTEKYELPGRLSLGEPRRLLIGKYVWSYVRRPGDERIGAVSPHPGRTGIATMRTCCCVC